MRRRLAFPRLFLAAAIAVAAGVAPGAGEHPWNDKRVYYVVVQDGLLREKGYFIRRTGSWRKNHCVVTEEDRFYFQPGERLTPARSVKIRTITTPEGAAIQRHEEVVIGDPGRENLLVEAGEIRFENTGSYGSPSRLAAPAGVIFDIGGEWLAARRLEAGASFSAEVIERRARRIRSETVVLRERIETPGRDGPAVWLAEFNSPGRSPLLARFTSDGRLIRMETDRLVYQVVGRDDFELGRLPDWRPEALPEPAPAPEESSPVPEPAPGPGIHAGPGVPAWDGFAWATFRTAPYGAWEGAVAASEYSQLQTGGNETILVVRRNAPGIDSLASFPLQVPPDILAYLATSPELPAADPAVIEAARLAVMDARTRQEEHNAIRSVSYLAGWINHNIQPLPWGEGDGRAARTLAARAGDSLAQARLFAAMARALGAPSRICLGMLIRPGRAVPQAWAEIWINGVWIPVDVAVNRVGLPAGYVLAERSGPEGTIQGDFLDFLASPGLSLNLISAGRETPGGGLAELVAGDRRTYAHAEGDWLANLYWGFALRLPPGWLGSARLDSVEASDPERLARMKCEALPGDYGSSRDDLDQLLAELRAGFDRFRVIDSRVAAFDAEGAVPVLFVDFACQDGGETLRCRQYLAPRRQRAFRLSFWAPANRFDEFAPAFDGILASLEF
ncbi:MAG: transglutaminase domain-containing protein [Planctomycetota bacterium]|jgi:transglutaminase-like putative cysteine protease|nr:transglutaminase domain-containing protein [Planctomycetota bacterium]